MAIEWATVTLRWNVAKRIPVATKSWLGRLWNDWYLDGYDRQEKITLLEVRERIEEAQV